MKRGGWLVHGWVNGQHRRDAIASETALASDQATRTEILEKLETLKSCSEDGFAVIDYLLFASLVQSHAARHPQRRRWLAGPLTFAIYAGLELVTRSSARLCRAARCCVERERG